MNECEFYQELISRMLDEDLSGEENVLLAEHLRSCEECSNLYMAFSMISEGIHEDMEEAPEKIRINVMSEIRRAEIAKQNKKKRKKILRPFVAAAACLVLVLSASLLTQPAMNKDSAAVYTKSSFEAAPAEAPAAPAPKAEERTTPESAASVPESIPAEGQSVPAEPAAAEELELSVATYSLSATDETDAVSDFAETVADERTWENLSSLLAGIPSELSAEETAGGETYSLSFSSNGNEEYLSIISWENRLYYTDPMDGIYKQSECSVDIIADFLT